MPAPNSSNLKVAIVHDWLVGGGAEHVVLELHRMFPDAPIYTSYCTDEWRKKLDGKVITGFLQRWPFNKLRKFAGVLRIWWFGHLDFSGYDLVISSTGNGEAFGIKTPKGVKHLCYCHTPTHYYWRHYDLYMGRPGFGVLDPLARFGLRLLAGPLRKWDHRAAQRPDMLLANSNHIKKDIKKYYGRDATVVHPPVDVNYIRKITPKVKERHGFITVGRQVPQKHTELAIIACTKLGVPLTVVGDGPEHERLKGLSGPSVTFLGRAPDDITARARAEAEAFIFSAYDDFGLAPIAALAGGTPVIAYKAGGALDYVVEGKTGLFFDEQTVDSLINTLRKFDSAKFDPQIIRAAADEFSTVAFQKSMRACINQVTKGIRD